jgi:hypothetical protein
MELEQKHQLMFYTIVRSFATGENGPPAGDSGYVFVFETFTFIRGMREMYVAFW